MNLKAEKRQIAASNAGRPFVVSVAGFDPSGGAGVLADIKTFEQLDVCGLSAVTSVTYQNDKEFDGVDWVAAENIIRQIEVLLRRFDVRFFKIGLIENFEVLQQIVAFITKNVAGAIIVVDPIMKASAGFDFNRQPTAAFDTTLRAIYCITPNLPEAEDLWGAHYLDSLTEWRAVTNIYLKGGHSERDLLTDRLFTRDEVFEFPQMKIEGGGKHGSGCVLSAALTANLALGLPLVKAAKNAQLYTRNFLQSTPTLLGEHKNGIAVEEN
jgi:hydroxymethylpyrimidine/phosphomethylpyrimidine kinase